MIQIKAIRIQEFRGIRELDLNLNQQSFVVFGPNGSGKSGVVDAIDFALTGNVARLTGAGTGGLSVLRHGPHVHQRDNPDAARVSLTIVHVPSGQEAVLTRCVRTADQYVLMPSTPELEDAVAWAAQHPEVTLARREVMKYVNAEPGKRAQEVQALLKLDRVDETRRLLRTALTQTSRSASEAASEVSGAEDAMRRHLDLTTLLAPEMTDVVNRHRELLGLDPLAIITEQTNLKEGLASGDGISFNRVSALRDVTALREATSQSDTLTSAAKELVDALRKLEDDPGILDALRHRQLVEIGLLLTESTCPLCDQSWQGENSLRDHLSAKLVRSQAAADLQRAMRSATDMLTTELKTVRGLIQASQPHAATLHRNTLHTDLGSWGTDLTMLETQLGSVDTARCQLDRLTGDILSVPAAVATGLPDLQAAVEALPDQTATKAAESFLTVAQERWKRVRQGRARRTKAASANKTAQTVYETFNEVADAALTALYKSVEDDFSNYYRQINSDDESTFKAGLAPTAGKLGLEVDFYGLGMFPPMAYHSEGHQDGMGVCLYLALIDQLLRSNFRLAVLDDVVTSVDANHRRNFCKLLKDFFPDVQFIITTHDEVWARQMQSSGLVGRRSLARLHGWTVDGGPVFGKGTDIWSQIEADLAIDNVPGAAHKLRRNLEAELSDIAAGLQGQVVFRPDNSYDLNAFFSAVKGRHGELLKKAAASANSWNNDSVKAQVEAMKAQRAESISEQDGENWAINKLVHNNDWATMSRADFEPVVDACRQFLGLFTCPNAACGAWIEVDGPPGNETALRCPCGAYNLNLRKK
ncbi:AAA family ATPase [Nakamurella sp. A5-74]|uniref:AAA family ATPase n=1 Tax=Nakamurella sp. A5-74 TaxID=3158264 RepID=A0AAU8DQC4_9ACTN